MNTPEAEILSVEGLSEFLGVPVGTVRGLTRQRTLKREKNPIPHFVLGKRTYFRKASVLAWIARREAR